MRRSQKILIGILIVLILIQFIRPARNEGKEMFSTDITHSVTIPANIQSKLKSSCYDCHSNNTNYPWYSNIQPMGWWLANHIREGKAELNFNEFGSYSRRRQLSKLKSISESIKDGSMPLSSYTLVHQSARLSEEDERTIVDWAEKAKDSLSNL